MRGRLYRRDFLKLASLLPMLALPLPEMQNRLMASLSNKIHPNILILVFDALSASHLSMDGYPRKTTPNIDRFAQRSIVYHSHYSAGSHTSSGVSSIFTGVYPWTHHAYHTTSAPTDFFMHQNIFNLYPRDTYRFFYSHNLLVNLLLNESRQVIDLFTYPRYLGVKDTQYSDLIFDKDYNVSFWAEQVILRDSGTNPSSPFFSLLYRGTKWIQKLLLVEKYSSDFPHGLPNLSDIYYFLEDAIDWMIRSLSNFQQPFLGYVHLLPPHEPYSPRKEFIGRFKDNYMPLEKPQHVLSDRLDHAVIQEMRLAYDEHLAYTDAEFGRLLDALESQGVLDNTILILTSDHGELFERGIRGHVTPVLFQPVIRVPLIISLPGSKKRLDIETSTSCVDILPTLLHIINQQIPGWVEGKILPGITQNSNLQDRPIFSVDAKSNSKFQPLTKGTIAMLLGPYKLICYEGYPNYDNQFELFDLSQDPEEVVDLSSNRLSLLSDMKAALSDQLIQYNHPNFLKNSH